MDRNWTNITQYSNKQRDRNWTNIKIQNNQDKFHTIGPKAINIYGQNWPITLVNYKFAMKFRKTTFSIRIIFLLCHYFGGQFFPFNPLPFDSDTLFQSFTWSFPNIPPPFFHFLFSSQLGPLHLPLLKNILLIIQILKDIKIQVSYTCKQS